MSAAGDFDSFASWVVTQIAETHPITDDEQHNWCFFCDATDAEKPYDVFDHEHDCLWVRCRRRCGLPITPDDIVVPGPEAPYGNHIVKPHPQPEET